MRALGGPQSPPVGGDRQAFRGGQRSALRLKNAQQISVESEVIGPAAGEGLRAHCAALALQPCDVLGGINRRGAKPGYENRTHWNAPDAH